MMLSLLLLAAQATTPAPARVPARTRAPATAEREAGTWRMQGGGFLARQCLGMA